MHYPRCSTYTCRIKKSNVLKNVRVFNPHSILMLPNRIHKTLPSPLDLYYPYGLIPELLDILMQYVYRMHLKWPTKTALLTLKTSQLKQDFVSLYFQEYMITHFKLPMSSVFINITLFPILHIL
jgi:hypothetical protein